MSSGLVDLLWGCGDLDRLFAAGADRTTTPWPCGDKTKQGRAWDPSKVAELLRSPVDLVDVDPREVRCSQPWILRHHVDYYRSGRWELSGRPSADQFDEHNRFPVIVSDYLGRSLILSGHHRTAAALIDGRLVRARMAATEATFRVTPNLRVDPASDIVGAQAAADLLTRGAEVAVFHLAAARDLLERACVPADDIGVAIDQARARLAARPNGRFE